MLAPRLAMSYSISTLLLRNLSDVFGENDPTRRRAALYELWNEDGVFYDPSKGAFRGRDEIDRIAGAIKATRPDFRYQPISEPEELGNGGRVKWVAGRPARRRLTPELISSSPTAQASAHYKVNSLGFASTLMLPARKVNVGFKYFKKFEDRSTFQGYSFQITASIKF